jgi:hypothetical protein
MRKNGGNEEVGGGAGQPGRPIEAPRCRGARTTRKLVDDSLDAVLAVRPGERGEMAHEVAKCFLQHLDEHGLSPNVGWSPSTPVDADVSRLLDVIEGVARGLRLCGRGTEADVTWALLLRELLARLLAARFGRWARDAAGPFPWWKLRIPAPVFASAAANDRLAELLSSEAQRGIIHELDPLLRRAAAMAALFSHIEVSTRSIIRAREELRDGKRRKNAERKRAAERGP